MPTIDIQLPTAEVPAGFKRPKQIVPSTVTRLSSRHRDALSAIQAGLVDAQATLPSGKQVRTGGDALVYLLEQVAVELEAE